MKLKITYHKKEWVSAYLFLLPAIAILIIFYVIPLIIGFVTSLYVGRGMGERFGWFHNYHWLVKDADFWNSLKVTLIFTGGFTVVSGIIGLGLALLLNDPKLKFVNFFKAAIFVPYIIALVVIGLVWQYMFNDIFGVINYFFSSIGLKRLPWLKSPGLALLSLIIIQIWYTAGFNMVLFLSGLQALPKDYYDAAQVDGAGDWHQLIYITIPLLVPTIIFVVLISILNGFINVFTLAKIVTQGGPINATNVLILYIYDLGFERLNFPLANALTYITFIMLALFSFVQYKLQEKTIFGLRK